MRAPPTTVEFLASLAARHSAWPALREGGTQLDYATLHGLVCQCGHALVQLGVRRGQRVAVSGPELGMELVLLLAAEGLGAITTSFRGDTDADAAWLFGHVDWVFSTQPQQLPGNTRFVLVDAAFAQALRRPLQGEPPAWVAPADDEPQRIVRTSGSSGASKFMLLTRRMQEWWIRCALETEGAAMEHGARYLVLSPMVINAAFARVSGTLRRGGLVMSGPGSDIVNLAPTHITGLPVQFEQLVEELPPGYAAARSVWVSSFGGPASLALRARVAQVFGAPLRNGYGSNETAVVCEDLDAAGTGVLRAGAEVRVLDDHGQPQPEGVLGRLALRTPGLVEGYLERPEESAAVFRDGWFISGDVGALLAPRVLRLAGRHDDLVNVGGIKVPAAQFEAALRAQAGIADAALLAVNLADGASLGVAAVLREGVAFETGMKQVRDALRLDPGTTARVLFVQQIPRLPEGKVDRLALLEAFRRPQSPDR
ncbi:MAG TPA: class I adenylate-forming enzyme family protein [Ramlibacter sp.]|nr:class I adenylate-forming enzyme family protein [Ramlibacter sp.]